MYNIRTIFPLLLGIFFVCSAAKGVDEEAEKVKKAASLQLQAYLHNVPHGSEGQFGFTDRAEMRSAIVSAPYHMLTLSREVFPDRKLNNSELLNYLQVTHEWRVPISVNGVHRALLTVVATGGKCDIADMGGTGLAGELQLVNRNRRPGYYYYLLHIYSLSADILVEAPNPNSFKDATCIPLTSAHMAIPGLTGLSQPLLSVLRQIAAVLNN